MEQTRRVMRPVDEPSTGLLQRVEDLVPLGVELLLISNARRWSERSPSLFTQRAAASASSIRSWGLVRTCAASASGGWLVWPA